MTKPSLQERIAGLRNAFNIRLPLQMAQITELYKQLLTEKACHSARIDLHRILHSLKGSSASFGMHELNSVVTAAEIEARQIVEQKISDPAHLERGLGQYIASLHHVIQGVDRKLPIHSKHSGYEIPAATTTVDGMPMVYLCDDDQIQAEHLAAQLECFCYKVRVFTEILALIEATKLQRPHAVIMDIVFPEGTDAGLDAMAQLQNLTKLPLQCLFLSTRRDFDARLNGVQAGGAAYYIKPVNVHDLVDTLDKITKQQQPEPYRIMVVDDDPDISQYHALILENAGMDTLVVNHPPEVLEQLDLFNPDLILVDMYMPICNGRDLACVIRQIPRFVGLPIVYLSGETDQVRQFSAMRVGADGFLTKPIDPSVLIADVTVRAERMRILRGFMIHDSLTGLLNHTTIKQFLRRALDIAQRQHQFLSFVMIDIDHFKSVNDRFGHTVGDQVLLAISRLLRQWLRQTDVIGRYGGEEFAGILLNADSTQAKAIIDALREGFSSVQFYSEGIPFTCTFSAGVASFPPLDDIALLSEAADRALYAAKAGGRNCVMCMPKESY